MYHVSFHKSPAFLPLLQRSMPMATISKDLADKLVTGNGYYSDDPRVIRIVEYTNAWGAQAWGIEYARDLGKYSASEYIINPKVYWEAE